MADDGRCPVCGLIVMGTPGSLTPIHTEPGNPNKQCPGGTIQPR